LKAYVGTYDHRLVCRLETIIDVDPWYHSGLGALSVRLDF